MLSGADLEVRLFENERSGGPGAMRDWWCPWCARLPAGTTAMRRCDGYSRRAVTLRWCSCPVGAQVTGRTGTIRRVSEGSHL